MVLINLILSVDVVCECFPAPHPDDELLAVGVEEDLGGVVGAALVAEVELGVVDDDPLTVLEMDKQMK